MDDGRERLSEAARQMIMTSDLVRRDPRKGEMLACMEVCDRFRRRVSVSDFLWRSVRSAKANGRLRLEYEL